MKRALISLEQKYGGHIRGIERIMSEHDPRYGNTNVGTHEGGDRMNSCYHQYAHTYEKALEYVGEPKVIVEVGILTGIGLAIWCDMFPNSRVIGLDITLQHYKNNLDNLKSLGAFSQNQPETFVFDQYVDNSQLLDIVLRGDKIDFFIDDGAHTPQSIIKTYQSAKPFLSDKFSYLVEDHISTRSFLKLNQDHRYVDTTDRQLSLIQK